jgi:hypothetical protein
MNAELEGRLREFEAARYAVVELVGGLGEEAFRLRYEEGRWSIAECLDHLITVGHKIVPAMDAAIARARAEGRTSDGPFRYGPLESWFARAIGRVPPRPRLPAPRIYAPARRPRRTIPRTVAEFQVLQDEYARVVRASNGLDLARIKIASPITPLIRLSLGKWLEGMAGHQRRHLWQAERVKQALGAS